MLCVLRDAPSRRSSGCGRLSMAYTTFPHPEERPSAASRRTHEARRRSSSARSGEMAAQRDEQRVGLCWRRVEAADEARDVARPAGEAPAILLEPIEHT